jgi:DNA-binding Xre family transcriptional regulator
MHTSDKSILRLIELLKFQNKITTAKNFAEIIEMQAGTISKIQSGKCHFTVEQIDTICQKFKVNPNFIFGYETQVFRNDLDTHIKDFMMNKKVNKK